MQKCRKYYYLFCLLISLKNKIEGIKSKFLNSTNKFDRSSIRTYLYAFFSNNCMYIVRTSRNIINLFFIIFMNKQIKFIEHSFLSACILDKLRNTFDHILINV